MPYVYNIIYLHDNSTKTFDSDIFFLTVFFYNIMKTPSINIGIFGSRLAENVSTKLLDKLNYL